MEVENHLFVIYPKGRCLLPWLFQGVEYYLKSDPASILLLGDSRDGKSSEPQAHEASRKLIRCVTRAQYCLLDLEPSQS